MIRSDTSKRHLILSMFIKTDVSYIHLHNGAAKISYKHLSLLCYPNIHSDFSLDNVLKLNIRDTYTENLVHCTTPSFQQCPVRRSITAHGAECQTTGLNHCLWQLL